MRGGCPTRGDIGIGQAWPVMRVPVAAVRSGGAPMKPWLSRVNGGAGHGPELI